MAEHGSGIIRTGRHAPLEDAADEILRRHLSGITRNAEKSDVLTPWKWQDRLSREVYVKTGVPDGALRRGIFHRTGVDRESGLGHLNSTQGIPQTKSLGHGPSPSGWDTE